MRATYKSLAALGLLAVAGAAFAVPTFAWINTFAGTGTGYGGGVVATKIDSAGNVYVVGNTFVGSGTSAFFDIQIVKYNSAGVQLWSQTIDQGFDDFANDAVIDSAGNIYVTGFVGRDAGDLDTDIICAKYNSAGVQQFLSAYIPPTNNKDDFGYSISLDGAGGAFIAGEAPEAGPSYDAGLYRCNSAGTISLLASIGTPGAYERFDIVLTQGSDAVVSGPIKEGTGANDYGARVNKYSNTGSLIWTTNYNSGSGESLDQPFDMDIVTGGNAIVVVGRSGVTVTGQSFSNQLGWVRRIQSNGTVNFTSAFGNGSDVVISAAGGGQGQNSYVASYISNAAGAANTYDINVRQFNSTGAQIGNQNYSNVANQNEIVSDAHVTLAGEFIVAGTSVLSSADQDMLLLSYSNTLVQNYALLYNNPANNDWDNSFTMDVASGAIVLGGFSDDATRRNNAVVKFTTSEIVNPSSFTIVQGQPFGGNVASLAASDNNKVFLLNDESDSTGEIVFTRTVSTLVPSSMLVKAETSASRNDLSQFTSAYKFAAPAGYQQIDFRTSSLSDVQYQVNVTSPANYVSGTGEVRLRILWIPQSDLEAADGWAENVDWIQWELQ